MVGLEPSRAFQCDAMCRGFVPCCARDKQKKEVAARAKKSSWLGFLLGVVVFACNATKNTQRHLRCSASTT